MVLLFGNYSPLDPGLSVGGRGGGEKRCRRSSNSLMIESQVGVYVCVKRPAVVLGS